MDWEPRGRTLSFWGIQKASQRRWNPEDGQQYGSEVKATWSPGQTECGRTRCLGQAGRLRVARGESEKDVAKGFRRPNLVFCERPGGFKVGKRHG